MSNFVPKTPIAIQIRRIIFDRHNDVDKPFTNDDVFTVLKQGGDMDPEWIIDDLEPYINEICRMGLTRNIAQNFTTIWLKLFDVMELRHCISCGSDVFLGKREDQVCPNPSCRIAL